MRGAPRAPQATQATRAHIFPVLSVSPHFLTSTQLNATTTPLFIFSVGCFVVVRAYSPALNLVFTVDAVQRVHFWPLRVLGFPVPAARVCCSTLDYVPLVSPRGFDDDGQMLGRTPKPRLDSVAYWEAHWVARF